VSNRAEKLLLQMHDSPTNCTLGDLYTVYSGFGFELRRGRKHDIVKHPKYGWLRASLPRKHESIALGYFEHAVKTINELKQIESGGSKNEE